MLIVAQDFILWPRVERGEGIHSPQQVFNLSGQNMAAPPRFQPLPTLLQCLLYGFRQRLTSFAGDLPGEAFSLVILNAERHDWLLYTMHDTFI